MAQANIDLTCDFESEIDWYIEFIGAASVE